MTTTTTPDIRTDDYAATVRRLSLLGIPGDVAAPLVTYVDALNAAQLVLARTEYHHMIRGYYNAEPGRARDALRVSATVADLAQWFDVDHDATGAGKYVQVVDMFDGAARSVHSVVVKATGAVCKSAGWRKGPAKSTAAATKGQPITRYTLTDDDSLASLLATLGQNPLNVHGGYLYS